MHESRRETLGRLLEPVAAVEALPEPRSIALALAITIALFGVAGVIVGTDSFQDEGPLADRLFNLVNEKTIPAFFSGAILVAGGLCSLLAARCRLYGKHRLWIGFGALLILMSADEVIQFHERLESWTGVDWSCSTSWSCWGPRTSG